MKSFYLSESLKFLKEKAPSTTKIYQNIPKNVPEKYYENHIKIKKADNF